MVSPKKVLSIVIISLCLFLPNLANAAETADWGDVVNVQYSLYLDREHTDPVEGNVDQNINHIYLSNQATVPSNIQELYPKASSTYLDKFKQGIIGMSENQQKNVYIEAKDGYSNDPSHQLYEKDLYFVIKLLEIVYDSSEHETSGTGSSPNSDLSTLVFYGGIIAILGGGLSFWIYRSSQARKLIKLDESSQQHWGSKSRVEAIKKDKSQIKELRELTESLTGSEETIEKKEVKFHRRRN